MRSILGWSMLLLVFVVPVLFLFLRSITFGWRYPDLFPSDWSMRAWHVIAGDPQILQALLTTMLVGITVVALNLLLGIPAAYALSHGRLKGVVWLETILFLPILVPVLAIAMGLHITMIRLGLADHISGVILIHLLPTLPYTIRVLRSGFDRIAPGWRRLGDTLGAPRITLFVTGLLPMMRPSLRSAAVLAFVISLSQYVLTAIIGGGQVTTLPLLYYPFFDSADQAVIAGFSVVFAALPAVFLLLWESLMAGFTYLLRRT
ncbi:ABC transporter permease [Alkalicoccus chagannorensis]|uniref:ABC transporter permease n=1 Tax=Alkalicoccus chagannorensis TaxID=427072 RepID=UPI0003FA8CC1|nr:ABC transporter permease subunit [Alkalicoccus chagannorensis]